MSEIKDLATRFDELAKQDSSLIAQANTLGKKTAYAVASWESLRNSVQSFDRLGREAMALLELPETGGYNSIEAWLNYLFTHTADVHTTNVIPAWLGEKKIPTKLIERRIYNAAEASAAVLRQEKEQGKGDGLTANKRIQLALTNDPNRNWTVLDLAKIGQCTNGNVSRCQAYRVWRDGQHKTGNIRRGFKTHDGSVEAKDDAVCRHCGEPVTPWRCDQCDSDIADACRECHAGTSHNQ